MNNIIYKSLILFSITALIGAIVYRVYSLNWLGVFLSFSLIIPAYIVLLKQLKFKQIPPNIIKKSERNCNQTNPILPQEKIKLISLICAYLAIVISLFTLLLIKRTDLSIISPWEQIPTYFFCFYFFSIFLLLFIISRAEVKKTLVFSLIGLQYFLSLSIAIIIYKIGYGFDPFIHQATLDLIDRTGSVNPKPFYYLGQYSLEIITHKLSGINLVLIDKYLLPVFSAIYLPFSLYAFLNHWFEDKKINYLLLLTILILPFPYLVLSTPQNLSYLFLIITICLSLTATEKIDHIICLLLALTTLSIHPIAGIPALFYIISNILYKLKIKYKAFFYFLIFLFSSISLPLAFYLLESGQGFSISLSLPNWPGLFLSTSQNVILNYTYLYASNLKYLLALLVFGGIFLAIKNYKQSRILFLNILISISLIISYILIKQLSFEYLIDYERNNFSERILLVSLIFLFPFIFLSLYYLIKNLFLKNKLIIFYSTIFISLLISASLYISYPRLDNYHNSKGYSTGIDDVEAVNWIEKNSQNNYIVLANQQVSVAALKKFGFTTYYNDNFFYPIPTSGELYQYYLKMVYDYPSYETMRKAMETCNVNEAYFVLNKYWWASSKLIEEAKLSADSWHDINHGNIFIFKYSLRQP